MRGLEKIIFNEVLVLSVVSLRRFYFLKLNFVWIIVGIPLHDIFKEILMRVFPFNQRLSSNNLINIHIFYSPKDVQILIERLRRLLRWWFLQLVNSNLRFTFDLTRLAWQTWCHFSSCVCLAWLFLRSLKFLFHFHSFSGSADLV